jgi:GNAT superfamily N-acetyltransferase
MFLPPVPTTLDLDEEGFALVPHGLHATIETSLERNSPPNPDSFPLPAGYTLVQPDPVDLSAFKRLFRTIGDPWLWFGRLTHSDEEILSILTAPTTTLRYLFATDGAPVGLFEAQQEGDDTLQVTYFGLVPHATGMKLGPALMEHGLAQAWHPKIKRMWVHTCTFDHPAALSFYRRQGFTPFQQRVEIGHDPRLTGLLPREAAPHIPLADFSNP